MKTRKIASMLPLLAGIGLGIAALAVPFLLANHYIMVADKQYSSDSYLFFFWAKYYTVTGVNMIQSQMVTYDLGDFPIYAMATTIVGLILAAVSMFGGRGIVLNVKGRTFKLKLDTNPVWLLMFATIFVTLSYVYMNNAMQLLIGDLQQDNYVAEIGPSADFLLGSIIALAISTIMTAVKFLKENSKKDSKTGSVV